MGSTANRQIPYVEPTDALANFPTADKAQADRLDALFGIDTGWLAVTISAGFAPVAGTEPMMRRMGNVVYMKGAWLSTGITVNGTVGVGTLPTAIPVPVTGYLLAAGLPTVSGSGGVTYLGQFLIGAGGARTSIQIRNGPAISTQYWWSGCYTID